MSIHTIKNIQFSRLIKVEGRLREFNFRKTGLPNNSKCSVDTVDDRGNRIIFSMLNENGSWKLDTAIHPKWIYNYEKELHTVIEEELNNLH